MKDAALLSRRRLVPLTLMPMTVVALPTRAPSNWRQREVGRFEMTGSIAFAFANPANPPGVPTVPGNPCLFLVVTILVGKALPVNRALVRAHSAAVVHSVLLRPGVTILGRSLRADWARRSPVATFRSGRSWSRNAGATT